MLWGQPMVHNRVYLRVNFSASKTMKLPQEVDLFASKFHIYFYGNMKCTHFDKNVRLGCG